ncbi:DUF4112 domain-containing protein [Salinirubellus sp. GCM10025818]|jgi:hypothetical protein|uniref:DUF4112 domain-containing protein n=1 Tax=Salinirubellus TaxID=2162630 RepID=UPI0030CD7007
MDESFDAAFETGFGGTLPESVDEAAVERLRVVAYLLDESVGVPGTDIRLGIDPLVSAVPVVGDVVSGGVGLYIVLESAYLGVSFSTLVRMLANVALDVGGGSVPYVGVLFDAFFKSNKRNLELALRDLGYDPERERWETDEDDEGVSIEIEAPSQ